MFGTEYMEQDHPARTSDTLAKEKQGIEAQTAALDKEFDVIKEAWKERGFKEVAVRHWASGVIVEQSVGGDLLEPQIGIVKPLHSWLAALEFEVCHSGCCRGCFA